MKYVSTRGIAPSLSFDDVLLAGLATDGGLYVPETWPTFSAAEIRAMRGLSYQELAITIMAPFVADCLTESELRTLVGKAYANFHHTAIAPLKQLDANLWVMELFHGPTLAFKDYALQMLGQLFDHVLQKRGEKVTIVGATSGDTGSAAIEACRDRDAINIFILHPKGRVSDVQRRQMTTVPAANVTNIALDGSFDDCQDMVKAMFNDPAFRADMNLSAVNSINWARIMAQVVYYFWAALRLGAPDREVAFSVPTGNFGNVFAGYVAQKMGLPVHKFIVGSNKNDILTRFFNTKSMEKMGVVPTISPSMDIQISSNFERLLFELSDRNGAAVRQYMDQFKTDGRYTVSGKNWDQAFHLFAGFAYDDDATKAIITDFYTRTGELLDPHSAIGIEAARAAHIPADVPVVALATAHPAKFPAAVESATGQHPALPTFLADLFHREERITNQPNDLAVVQSFIREKVS